MVSTGQRNKDGGHAILSPIAKNPMLHANFTAVCVTELEHVLHCRNSDFLGYFWCQMSAKLTMVNDNQKKISPRHGRQSLLLRQESTVLVSGIQGREG